MAKFTRNNNPKRKKVRKHLDYTERSVMAAKEMIDDRRIGLEIPKECYEKKWDLEKQ